jgi:hypothetical protein
MPLSKMQTLGVLTESPPDDVFLLFLFLIFLVVVLLQYVVVLHSGTQEAI